MQSSSQNRASSGVTFYRAWLGLGDALQDLDGARARGLLKKWDRSWSNLKEILRS